MRVAVDTGGTFTDFVAEVEGQLLTYKVPSTPEDPARAILEGLRVLSSRTGRPPEEVLHGTTVGTNAFLTRRGARVALLTTRGFEDVIFIGRQARPELYNFLVQKPPPVVARSLVLGVRERVRADGTVELPLSEEEIARVRLWVKQKRPEALAISLLHAYAFPEHERRLAKALADLGIHLSLSSEIRPEFREFERTSTTLLNAYLAPVVGRYVRRLGKALPGARIFIMQSSGGLLPVEEVEGRAVMTLLSGPAGGVLGALAVARAQGFKRIITLDMGGTSTDVALCDGAPTYTREYEIEGHPVALPLIDIHTIGAGGGSLAWFDPGGALRVGPQSAGADPGPVCYGRGGRQPTVTDAHLFVGRLLPHRFLGGRMVLRPELAARALAEMAHLKGLSPETLALSILEIAATNMEAALRKVSLERGYDPREFVLVAFGGAGALQAAELAARLGISRVLVPRLSGVLSALGILVAEPRFDFAAGVRPGRDPASYEFLQRKMAALRKKALSAVKSLGFAERDLAVSESVDLRYAGQAFELTIPFGTDFQEAFRREHERLYGFHLGDRTLEATAVRVTVTVRRPPPVWPPFKGGRALQPAEKTLLLLSPEERRPAPVYLWEDLPQEAEFSGPALVVGDYATVFVPPGFLCAADGHGNLHLYPG
ncbi:hydantoinase/oxoprolinase family protein [Thermosulfurimonas marina]|uniref:Hydantoinase/oxoprolinase family protein n=1 Tax=Thermosulfurimonas marina TaxID=2047767 RepID=A0A6H1WST4_9BACT|nr:hydantoinase/oxoprolinase family protein [Thermosulfurimonas marina]QJA06238.1 hydantoinase/oxoprolinase family protein [Thermosulfurimonas marina]